MDENSQDSSKKSLEATGSIQQVCTNIRQAVERLKTDIRSVAAQTSSEFLLQKAELRTLYSEAQWPLLIEAYDGIVDAFQSAWTAKSVLGLKDASQPLVKTYCNLASSLCNLTDVSSSLCSQVVTKGVIHSLLADMRRPDFETDGEVVDQLTVAYLCILNNAANLCGDTANVLREAGGIEVIQHYNSSKSQKYKMAALFLASVTLDVEEKEALSSIMSRDNVSFMLTALRSALRDAQHLSSLDSIRYSVMEILTAISNVANFSAHFTKILLKLKFLDLLAAILTAPDSASQMPIGNLKPALSYTSVDEKVAAATCVWSLTFYADALDAIKAHDSLSKTLRELSQSAASAKLKKTASGVIWQVEGHSSAGSIPVSATLRREKLEPNKLQRNADATQEENNVPSPDERALKRSGSSTSGHVMISYCWNNQEAVLRIVQALKACGIPVWVDVESMQGSTVEAMANAVDSAAVVLICYSQKYFFSANCRAEAEYAFQLKKPIIPVRMHNYKATSWLGLILGARLWYDFSDVNSFDSIMPKVTKAVEDVLRTNKERDFAQIHSIMSSADAEPAESHSNNQHSYNVKSWSSSDVQHWLADNGLDPEKNKKLQLINGVRLYEIYVMQHKAPSFIYKQLLHQFNLDFCYLLDFLHALKELRPCCC